MKEIEFEVMSQKEVFEQMLRRIDSLAYIQADNGKLPYLKNNKKYPCNVISNQEIQDINKMNLELSSAMIDEPSNAFITSSNAQLIGLELKNSKKLNYNDFEEYIESGLVNEDLYNVFEKEKNQPVLVMFNVQDEEGELHPEYEYAYFINQFSEKSLGKSVDLLKNLIGGNTHAEQQLHFVINNFLANLGNYDSGIDDNISGEERNNIIKNSDKNFEEYKKASVLHKFYTNNKSKNEIELFEYLRKTNINQRHLENVLPEKSNIPLEILVKNIAQNKDGRFALIAFESLVFALRFSNPGFNAEKYFSPSVKSPEIMKISTKQIVQELERQKEEQKQRESMNRKKRLQQSRNSKNGRER